MAISAADLVNVPGGGTLSGGTCELESGSTLVLLHTVTTDAADIILSGTSSALLGGPCPSTITLEHSLTSVTSGDVRHPNQHGTLKLDAPASFTGTLAGLALGDVIDIGGTSWWRPGRHVAPSDRIA